MLIHSLVRYVHALEKMIIMLEDMWKKQQVGFVCPVSSLNNELMSSSVDKGFKFKGIKDLDIIEISVKWNKFYEIMQQKNEENIEKSKGGLEWMTTMVMKSS